MTDTPPPSASAEKFRAWRKQVKTVLTALPPPLHARLVEAAQYRRMPVAAAIREAIEEWLDTEEISRR